MEHFLPGAKVDSIDGGPMPGAMAVLNTLTTLVSICTSLVYAVQVELEWILRLL